MQLRDKEVGGWNLLTPTSLCYTMLLLNTRWRTGDETEHQTVELIGYWPSSAKRVTRTILKPQGSMSNLPESSPRGKRFPLGLFVCGFAISNFLTPPIMNSAGPSNAMLMVPLMGLLIGFMASQCGLLAVWGVLGPFRAPARLAITLTIGVFLMASFGVGAAVLDPPGYYLGEMTCSLLFLPLVLLAVQLPLWVFRLATGGRITHVGTHAGQSMTPQRQFGLGT